MERRESLGRLLFARGTPVVNSGPGRKRASKPSSGFADPRNAVLLILGGSVLIGGARKWLQAIRARRAIQQLAGDAVRPEDILAVADHGREGLFELFRIFETAREGALREAAGAALARLWARDQLVAEEEKAIVVRGFRADWSARRRYPRGLASPIPIEVRFGVPFLGRDPEGVQPDQLEWSHRISGTNRASLESFSPWRSGEQRARFTLIPGDFEANGPHRLALEARARVRDQAGAWEHALPHIPFRFEFDPLLRVDSLLAQPDAHSAEEFARTVRLAEPSPAREQPAFLGLNDQFALRDPPELLIATPLPCDLAHAIHVEIEGVPGLFPAGMLLVSTNASPAQASPVRAPLGPITGLPGSSIDRPGEVRLRAHLTPDPDRGWTDPEIRSVWPGTITTEWCPARLVRK